MKEMIVKTFNPLNTIHFSIHARVSHWSYF